MSRVIPHHSTPPSCADLETIAQAEFAEIPQELRRYAADVIIRVEDFPDEDVSAKWTWKAPSICWGCTGARPRTSIFSRAPPWRWI
jgi:predicted Zn-dependent protease with MMP-like domain